MSGRALEAVESLERRLAEVATELYALDSSGDTLFSRARADAGDASARAVIDRLAAAWDDYSRAKAALEGVRTAIRAGQPETADRLLGPGAVTTAGGGTMAIGELLGDLQWRVGVVGAETAGVAEIARRTIGRLDSATAAAHELEQRARPLAAAGEPELGAVRDALDRATTAVARDPTAAPPEVDAVERLLERARARLEQLQRQQAELPAALAGAQRRLEHIEALARRGAEGLAAAHAKVNAPTGLRQPLDPRSEGHQGLRPWLDRIEDQAAAGDWQEAAGALATWDKAAAAWEARVAEVAEANEAPVARRNELRGLLDAYRAKAAALGHDEDGRLEGLHAAARDVLYTAPCALPEAERLVREYLQAVNAAAAASRR